MHGGMATNTQPEAPLVIGLSVLYEDEPDGRVIAHIPQVLGAISRGDDRRAARAAVRGVLRDLIVGYLEPIELLEELLAAEPLRLVIEP
jgi:predicted RNase H-like HicB family nuclease